ncbi:odorant receptor Or1 [Solenopsis invicta]|uniref:odorant receptor Or1 n=1 Tax=Solenopsis invicta TaxID=13686 RepID=UPI000E33FD3D|nr:odorant receptor Or1 [Solenopsis invicta]XP_039306260.1 odorant receptor Or1 [Solenopsis invicta]
MGRGIIAPNFHLKLSLTIIYFLGTWPPATGKFRLLYLLYTACCLIFMLGILLAAEIANVLVHWGDMTKFVAVATLLMTNSSHASKALILLRRQTRIQALLDTANSPAFSRYDEEYQDILVNYTWKAIFHHVVYQSFGGIAVFCWGFTPISDLIAGRSRRLPMEGWYPYNVTATPAFEITAAHQGIAIIIACFHNVAMDTLMTGLIAVACSQLAILERNITSINNEGNIRGMRNNDTGKSLAMEKTVLSYQLLKRCAVHSNIIFDFTSEIQNIFGTAIFFQFLSNCMIICLIAFNVSQMKVYIPAVLIGMLTYMCCMTYQIFIYCWHGNELHLHSMRLVTAAYSNNWFSNTEEFKRGLQIIMTRAHRPLTLSAGRVMTLSLDTFVQIMRTSYSIFTVLQGSAA